MIQLNRAAMHDGIEFINDSASDEKIIAVLNYLGEHLTEDISIDTLSAHFFLSRSYLMHTFKEQTGYTIGNYLSTKRLLLAKDLIAEGAPITEVCYACGFKNYFDLFARIQKKFWRGPTRVSPKPEILASNFFSHLLYEQQRLHLTGALPSHS